MSPTDNTKANRYSGFFCPVPFESAYIDYHGNMNPHCEGLVTVSMGNLKNGSFSDVWNSETAQKIRESILEAPFNSAMIGDAGLCRKEGYQGLKKLIISHTRIL